MVPAKSESLLQQFSDYELALCERSNRACRRPRVERFFALISRLGDGIVWYLLMLLLPLAYGWAAVGVSMAMGGTALLGLVAYKALKSGTTRPRPFRVSGNIKPGTAPLDPFSFPSGHTLHATSFSLIAVSQFPELAWLLAPFSGLIAASRVVLGLHYPSDVLAGAVIGTSLAMLGVSFL